MTDIILPPAHELTAGAPGAAPALDMIEKYYYYSPTCHCDACTEVRGISERARAALEREP